MTPAPHCAAEANAAKYLAAEAAFKACETAVLSHGGMGYAKEFHVERYLREAMIMRIAPVTSHMILNFIGRESAGPAALLLSMVGGRRLQSVEHIHLT